MKKNETNSINMFNAVMQTMNDYKKVWSDNKTLRSAVASFWHEIKGLGEKGIVQKTSSKSATQNKAQAKNEMINLALAHLNAGKAYATLTKNTGLRESCRISKSKLKRMKDAEADDICQGIHDFIHPHIKQLKTYGAHAKSISAFQKAIKNYTDLLGKPASKIALSKAATKTIGLTIPALKLQLSDVIDPLVAQYQNTHPDFYNHYVSARVIKNVGAHHSSNVSGTVYDNNGTPLKGATVNVNDTDRLKVTGANGVYKFIGFTSGTWIITVKAPGFISLSKSLEIDSKRTVTLDFNLLRV